MDIEAGTQLEGYLKPLSVELEIFKFTENDKQGDKRTVGELFKELGAEVASKIVQTEVRIR